MRLFIMILSAVLIATLNAQNNWSAWGPTGDPELDTCNKPCGSCGTITEMRVCPNNSVCPGPSTRQLPCNIQPCHYPNNSCCEPYKKLRMGQAYSCV